MQSPTCTICRETQSKKANGRSDSEIGYVQQLVGLVDDVHHTLDNLVFLWFDIVIVIKYRIW